MKTKKLDNNGCLETRGDFGGLGLDRGWEPTHTGAMTQSDAYVGGGMVSLLH